MAFNSTTIDWPGLTHTFNPVTGCKRGCSYCYARKLWRFRFQDRYGVPFEHILFHPERLDKRPPKDANRIFVGSMSDIEYWDRDDVQRVLNYCSAFRRCEYMFLSKNHMAYHGFAWPFNTMQGLTMALTQADFCQAGNIEQMLDYPRPYLSLEPLMGKLQVKVPDKFETVIVGAMTGPGAVKPLPEWIQSVRDNVPAEKIHWKNNIRKYLD